MESRLFSHIHMITIKITVLGWWDWSWKKQTNKQRKISSVGSVDQLVQKSVGTVKPCRIGGKTEVTVATLNHSKKLENKVYEEVQRGKQSQRGNAFHTSPKHTRIKTEGSVIRGLLDIFKKEWPVLYNAFYNVTNLK